MDRSVVENAKGIVGNENRSFEAVLEQLEMTRRELEKEKEKAEKATESANKMRSRAQSEKDKIEQLKANEMEKVKREAEKIINAAKRQSSDFLLQLEKLKKEVDTSNATEVARKTRREIKNRLGEMDDIVNPRELADNWDNDYKLPRPVVKGDSVIIRSIGDGEVVEVKNDNVIVQSGMLKTRVKMGDLMLIEKKKKQPPKTGRSVYRTTSRADADVKTELDLRGQTVDEALMNLSLFIDKCVLNNISEIRIIHGKGTGALRTAVTQELRNH